MKVECKKHFVWVDSDVGCLDCKAMVVVNTSNPVPIDPDNNWYLIDVFQSYCNGVVITKDYGALPVTWPLLGLWPNIVALRINSNLRCEQQVSVLLRANNEFIGTVPYFNTRISGTVTMFQFRTELGILVWVSQSALAVAANSGVLSPGKMYNIELDAFYLKIKPVTPIGGTISLNSGRATGLGGNSNP